MSTEVIQNGFYCCCGGNCANCSDPMPLQFQVALANITDQNCDECDSLNGLFILDLDISGTCTIGDLWCCWVYHYPSDICSVSKRLVLQMLKDATPGNPFYISVSIFDWSDTNGFGWTQRYSTKQPCNQFNNTLIPVDNDLTSDCANSSSSCRVTAL